MEFYYQQLNEIIHSRLRLAILSTLVHNGETEFRLLKELTGSSDGNLSIQTKKLNENEYISVNKEFLEGKPITKFSITEKGQRDYDIYLTRLQKLLMI